MNVQRVAALLQDKEQVIRETVLDKAKEKDLILYGARSFNLQAPQHLRKKTMDYDLLSKKPKKVAKEIAETLRRRLGREVTIKKAAHQGTYKISVNGEQVIDITQLKTKPKTKKVWGTEVRHLKSIKRNAVRLSRKKGLEYRREKDVDTLDRIRRIEKMENIFNKF